MRPGGGELRALRRSPSDTRRKETPDAGPGVPARTFHRGALAAGGAAAGCCTGSPAPPRMRVGPAGVHSLRLHGGCPFPPRLLSGALLQAQRPSPPRPAPPPVLRRIQGPSRRIRAPPLWGERGARAAAAPSRAAATAAGSGGGKGGGWARGGCRRRVRPREERVHAGEGLPPSPPSSPTPSFAGPLLHAPRRAGVGVGEGRRRRRRRG